MANFQLPDVIPVGSTAPQIASLGMLIDRLAQRRMQQQNMDRQAQAQAETERYHRGREQMAWDREAGRDRRAQQEAEFKRAKEDRLARSGAARDFSSALGKGVPMDTAALSLAPVGGSVEPEMGMEPFTPSTSPQADADLAAASEAAGVASTGAAPAPLPLSTVDPFESVQTLTKPGEVSSMGSSYPRIAGLTPIKANPFQETGRQIVSFGDDAEQYTIDPDGAKQAAADERTQNISTLDQMIAGLPEGSPQRRALEMSKTALITQNAGLGQKEAAKMATTGASLASNADLQQNAQAGRMELQKQRHTDRLAEIAARNKRKQAAYVASMPSAGGPDSALARLPVKSRLQVERFVSSSWDKLLRQRNWFKFHGPGTDRLKLADINAAATGPDAGAQHMEAMMNFFGYIRGGVPAKNETDEFKKMTGSLTNKLDNIGSMLGISGLGQGIANGNFDETHIMGNYSTMPEGQRAALHRAIKESAHFLASAADRAITSAVKSFNRSGLPEREKATDLANGARYFISKRPIQYWPDVPLGGANESNTEEAVTPTADGGAVEQPKKQSATESLLKSLGL